MPTDLAGVQFAFTNGALSIRCDGFTGDIVLSRRAFRLRLLR